MTLAHLPFDPLDLRQLLAHWLDYRLPHYDDLERRVKTTLTGDKTAIVRVSYDADAGCAREYHVTLFTRTSETPDPERTVALAKRSKPAGFVLHHAIREAPSPDEATPADPRSAAFAQKAHAADAALTAVERLRADPRAPATSLAQAARSAYDQADAVREELELAITDGLEARDGMLLVPPMIVKIDMLADHFAWELLRVIRARFDRKPKEQAQAWRPDGIAVCRSCTCVFVPRRRATAAYCSLCAKRPAAPFVVGQRPFVPGESQTVRYPDRVGNVIVGWRTTAVGQCVDCGEPYHGRRDAMTCPACSNRNRQQRFRDRSGAGERRAARPGDGNAGV